MSLFTAFTSSFWDIFANIKALQTQDVQSHMTQSPSLYRTWTNSPSSLPLSIIPLNPESFQPKPAVSIFTNLHSWEVSICSVPSFYFYKQSLMKPLKGMIQHLFCRKRERKERQDVTQKLAVLSSRAGQLCGSHVILRCNLVHLPQLQLFNEP